MEDTLKRVIAIIAEDVATDKPITAEDRLIEDLDGDSLDKVKIGVACEQEFNIDIDDDTIDNWRTVGDVVKTITEALR